MLNFTGTLFFLNKNVVFPVHAEYPYFSADFRLKYYKNVQEWEYSDTPLIRSPTGQKNLALLTGGRINEGFLQENVWPFCHAAKKGGRNNKVTVSRRP